MSRAVASVVTRIRSAAGAALATLSSRTSMWRTVISDDDKLSPTLVHDGSGRTTGAARAGRRPGFVGDDQVIVDNDARVV